jgi:hypothetical protein
MTGGVLGNHLQVKTHSGTVRAPRLEAEARQSARRLHGDVAAITGYGPLRCLKLHDFGRVASHRENMRAPIFVAERVRIVSGKRGISDEDAGLRRADRWRAALACDSRERDRAFEIVDSISGGIERRDSDGELGADCLR